MGEARRKMNKLKNFPLAVVLLVLLSLTDICFAADNVAISKNQIETAAKNANTPAAKVAYEKIKAVYADPQKLRSAGKLENAVKSTRKAYLDYAAETEKIYRRGNVSAKEALDDLQNLRQIWDIADYLSREQYGQSFLDFELLNARRSVVALAGEILAASGVKLADSPILKDAFCLDAAMKVCEGEVRHLKEIKSNEEEILDKEIELLFYYSALGYGSEATQLGEKILPEAKKVFAKNREKILSVMSVLGEEYAMGGDFAGSEKIINERLSHIAQNPMDKEQDAKDTLAAQNDLIQIYFMQDRYLEGIKLLNDVLPNTDKLAADDTTKGLLLLSACSALDSQGLYKKADAMWRSMPKNSDITLDAIRVRSDMTRNKIYYGVTLANDFTLTMTDSIHWGSDHHMTLQDLCNVSSDYLKMGNAADALFVAQKAKELSGKRYGEGHPATIRAKMALADAYRLAGKGEFALKLDTEAQRECQSLYGNDAAPTLKAAFSLAADYALMGKSDQAQKLYEDNIISYRQKYGATDTELPWSAMNSLAMLCLEKGNLREALNLCNHIISAKRSFREQLSPEDTKTLLNVARYYYLSGNFDKADEYYDKTLASYEHLRRNAILTDEYLSGWFAGVVTVYKEQILTYINSQKSAAEILRLSDMCKARNLADRYNEYLALEKGDVKDEDKTQAKKFAAKISMLDEVLNKARQEGSDDLALSLISAKLWTLLDEHNFKNTLAEKYPVYKKLRESNLEKGSSFAEKLSAIPQCSYFVDYSLLPDKILITLAQKDRVIAAKTVDADKNFLRQCEIYRELLSVRNIDAFQERYGYLYKDLSGNYYVSETITERGIVGEDKDFNAARKELAKVLGNKLLSPLSEYLPADANNFIISPDGVLANIPFETLAYKKGIFIDEVDVSYVPSLSTLQLMINRKTAVANGKKEIFAVGAVDYGRYAAKSEERGFPFERGGDRAAILAKMGDMKWNYLPWTGEEVKSVAALFPRSSVVLKGKDASERRLREMDRSGELANYRYLLFSSHGLYVPPKPELSAILLRPDDNQKDGAYEYNGYVTVGEWMGYNLNTDLVYLSACESGLGKFESGEGVVGIPYALTVAGNKSAVMSLWNVGDKFAADFSTEFFTKVSKGDTPKTALSKTKREFMKDRRYGNPSVWSAFLLYGE